MRAEDTQSLDLLKPFLRIIVTDAASGPITAAALLSVKRLLLEDALGTLGAPGIAAAMQETVAALTFCKFEATHDTYDQMVLCNILQTLCAALACPSGCYLTDGDVVNMFEAAYRIGFDMQIVPYLSGALPACLRTDRRIAEALGAIAPCRQSLMQWTDAVD